IHVDVDVGEVQQLQNPVDHRVAERDQRIQAPEDDPVPKKLERPGPSKRANRVDDVVEQKVQGPQALRNACGPPWWAALMELLVHVASQPERTCLHSRCGRSRSRRLPPSRPGAERLLRSSPGT